MVDQPEEPDERDELPMVAVQSRRRLSIVWLIPLVAGLVAAWLVYTTVSEKGPTITVTFKTAEGLEAGKTKIKFRDVAVGSVNEIKISEDGSYIIVTADILKDAEKHLSEATKFWVVRPRLSASGVSGLGTLVSGSYIEMEPGLGAPARTFTGLEVPPVVQTYEIGRKYFLQSDRVGSLGAGSPIYYRGIEVGEVLGYELANDGTDVLFPIFVKKPYIHLVRESSRFWNVSGIDISFGADGVSVNTTSLESLLAGGVAFDGPARPDTDIAKEGTKFRLFDSRADVTAASYSEKVPYLANFDGSLRGLKAGAPVTFRGIEIGSVNDVRLEVDASTNAVRVPVRFEIEPQRVHLVNSEKQSGHYQIMRHLVEQGLRAQLKTGSLLTGQLFVDLDFHPDSPPAQLTTNGQYPEIPTVPADLEELTDSVKKLLAKLDSLPLNGLVGDLRKTLQDADHLITSPEIIKTVVSLDQTLQTAQAALLQAKTTLATTGEFVGENSELRYDLDQLLKQLSDTARSIRSLANYLEQHPEALIRGKNK